MTPAESGAVAGLLAIADSGPGGPRRVAATLRYLAELVDPDELEEIRRILFDR